HDTGDKLLQKAAAILQSACRAADINGRAGGDEFPLLLPRSSGAAARDGARGGRGRRDGDPRRRPRPVGERGAGQHRVRPR
ncbi:diguanylate cyclase, partial [Citrobacter sp. AAK_AS5]